MRISKPPQERRAELIAAARLLFDKKGVDKTRVSDIVRHVGVAQGVFYYYFNSKAEMVRVVVEQVTREMDAAIADILGAQGVDWCWRLARFIDLYLDLIDKFTEDGVAHLPPAGAELKNGTILDIERLLNAQMEKVIASGMRLGAVRAAYPRQTAQVLLLGLRALAERELPTRRMIYTIVEQGLGLEPHALLRHLGTAATG